MSDQQQRKIDPAHKLPCDFHAGHIRFGKGVQLETVRAAAERWLIEAVRGDLRRLELGQNSRETLASAFGQMYAGWDRGVNMEGPDTGFRETPMTPMELEARYVAAEIGIHIFQIANSAAFAPIIVYQTIQKYLGPVFADLEERAHDEAADAVRHHKISTDRWEALLELKCRDDLPPECRALVERVLGTETS